MLRIMCSGYAVAIMHPIPRPADVLRHFMYSRWGYSLAKLFRDEHIARVKAACGYDCQLLLPAPKPVLLLCAPKIAGLLPATCPR